MLPLRAFFYDNFTKPLDARMFTGRLIVRDGSDKEIATISLKAGPEASTLDAAIPATGFPVRVTLRVAFTPGAPEQQFDFQFPARTK